MDFGTLLSVAQRNEGAKQPIACYQTKYTPPKKQSKQTKSLSDNIKKFLARKEEEEKQKALEERRKKENLLALRDHKAQSRINKHLKVCKAANKSVLADAVDNENTAVTIAGPSQPDEDDYGYVSQEASAFYNQLMNKYNNLPAEKPLFSSGGKRTVKDIASTKDRVKQALKQQELEEALGHRRKRKSSVLKEGKSEEKIEDAISTEKSKEEEKDDKLKIKKRSLPPPMDFGALLKLAEKKQHEPIVIEVKPKVEEPERLMTKRQMKEYMKEKEWRERKEQREKNPEANKKVESKKVDVKKPTVKQNKAQNDSKPVIPSKQSTTTHAPLNKIPLKSSTISAKKPIDEKNQKSSMDKSEMLSKTSAKDKLLEERRQLELERKKLEEMRKTIEEEKRKLAQTKIKQDDPQTSVKQTSKPMPKPKMIEKSPLQKVVKPRQFSDVKPQSSMANGKAKHLPSSNMRPPMHKHGTSRDIKRPARRICDEDEYDSELDDFIDDGVEDESEDYSKYISEIFGYDKSKYRNVDDDDDTAMESNFAQQLKEEYVSTKIGIMEDLEDIRMEAMEKKQKAMMRKKVKK
ncbi:hypothetical protein KM043_011794 [Ampulex compressa]|nr:hypothetical protein KM043_011794 [Ampulex compressa]